jgi:hypothetical protein
MALSLSTLTLATVGLSACKKDDEEETSSAKKPEVNSEYVYDGTHVYTATDTNDYLVRNGQTDYRIVIPADYSASLRIARTEFVDLFEDATDINLTVMTDDQVQNPTQGKYISLGRTKLLENAGITIDSAELTADGHRVVTKDDDIYLCGGADEGTVFAVYTFMRLTFNYETYYYDCMEIDHVTEAKLKNYDVTDIPDFKYRAHSSDVTMYESKDYDENMFAWRLGYYGKEGTRGYYFMPVHERIDDFTQGKKSASTNARRWFPEWMYKNAEDEANYHPYWFSDNGGEQLCFSAHGDPEEYEAMVDTAFKKVEAHLKHYTPDKYPRYRVMTLTHMDNTNYCTCDACNEIIVDYGDSIAAVQVLFMNDLARRVDALLEANKNEPWYREDFQLLFFAYNHNYEPPARYDAATKEYVPIDDKVILHDRVIAWLCRNANGQSVFDEERNATLKSTLEGWSAVADHIWYWSYGTSFRNYMMPLDSFQYSTPEMYGYFCNKSDDFWFTQLQDSNAVGGNTSWHNLKLYLEAKQAWDTSLQPKELTEKWMNAMYRDAAPEMLRLFQTVRSYQRHVLIGIYELESNGDGSPEMTLADYWPIGILQGWLARIDQAKADVERYAAIDPELYEKLCKHIEIEAIGYMYLVLETQGFTISTEQRQEYIDRFKYDMEWLDIADMRIREGLSLSDWVSAL